MATITASHLLASSGHGTSETNAISSQISQRGQVMMSHSGLRSPSNLGSLKVRPRGVMAASQAMRKIVSQEVQSAKPVAEIAINKGMSIVFVSCEVGPWSKTGGLGDVLGGLPPAMAVSPIFPSIKN